MNFHERDEHQAPCPKFGARADGKLFRLFSAPRYTQSETSSQAAGMIPRRSFCMLRLSPWQRHHV